MRKHIERADWDKGLDERTANGAIHLIQRQHIDPNDPHNPIAKQHFADFQQAFGTPDRLKNGFLRTGGVLFLVRDAIDRVIGVLGSAPYRRHYHQIWEHNMTSADIIHMIHFYAVHPGHQGVGMAAALYRAFETETDFLRQHFYSSRRFSEMMRIHPYHGQKIHAMMARLRYQRIGLHPTKTDTAIWEKEAA